jgi:hypothetical protein
MENIFLSFVKAIFLLCVASYGFLFYTGKLKCSDEKEKIRKESVKKYKWILRVSILVTFIGGISILIVTIKKMIG